VLDILASSGGGIPDNSGHVLNRLVLAQQASILASEGLSPHRRPQHGDG
jgi:hypothetical protein